MARTHIRMKCPNCNYTYSTSIQGYVEDSIGVPLVRCPRCNQIYKDSEHKEWIQMSSLKKYFSISPRGNILSVFIALIPMVFLVRNDIELSRGAFWGIIIASWFIVNYIVISFRVNSKRCIQRIASSISRTNNEAYVALLAKFGEVYDCCIPKILILTRANKELIESAIKNKRVADIAVPDFISGINRGVVSEQTKRVHDREIRVIKQESTTTSYRCGKCGHNGPYEGNCPKCGSSLKRFKV